MKKILLATSALTLLAGAAAAEITLSGSGRVGVVSTGGTTTVTHRFRVNFNASGETDGGLTFGGYVRANMNGGSATTTVTDSNGDTVTVGRTAIGAPRVWISNGTATLTVGNASGAVAQNGNVWGCGVGFTGNCGDMSNANFTWASHASGGAGPNVVRVDFALGSANVSVSGGNGNDTEVAASFSAGAATVGISYDAGAGATGGTQLNVGFDAGSANIRVSLAQSNGTTGAVASMNYGMGSGTLEVYVGNQLNGAATGTNSVYGVSYMVDLGGAKAGVSYRSVAGTTTTDAGIKFSF